MANIFNQIISESKVPEDWNTDVIVNCVENKGEETVTIPKCYKDACVNSFFPHTARLCNSLLVECFPLTYDLNIFKSRTNRHFLTVGFF